MFNLLNVCLHKEWLHKQPASKYRALAHGSGDQDIRVSEIRKLEFATFAINRDSRQSESPFSEFLLTIPNRRYYTHISEIVNRIVKDHLLCLYAKIVPAQSKKLPIFRIFSASAVWKLAITVENLYT